MIYVVMAYMVMAYGVMACSEENAFPIYMEMLYIVMAYTAMTGHGADQDGPSGMRGPLRCM